MAASGGESWERLATVKLNLIKYIDKDFLLKSYKNLDIWFN